jgi:hypothetical protein
VIYPDQQLIPRHSSPLDTRFLKIGALYTTASGRMVQITDLGREVLCRYVDTQAREYVSFKPHVARTVLTRMDPAT